MKSNLLLVYSRREMRTLEYEQRMLLICLPIMNYFEYSAMPVPAPPNNGSTAKRRHQQWIQHLQFIGLHKHGLEDKAVCGHHQPS